MTIKAERLAKPDRLTPPETIYVVWFQERNGEPVSQGALKVKKDLTGEFEATTALPTFDVLITAEGDRTTKSPSGQVVLKAIVQE